MRSEEQWEYIGDCIYCGAHCYVMDGKFKSTTDMDCCCCVKGYESDNVEADEGDC